MWRRFWHAFGIHVWTQWDVPKPIPNDRRMQQFRRCDVCHKQQRHIF